MVNIAFYRFSVSEQIASSVYHLARRVRAPAAKRRYEKSGGPAFTAPVPHFGRGDDQIMQELLCLRYLVAKRHQERVT